MGKLKLTVNEEKTRIRRVPKGSSTFWDTRSTDIFGENRPGVPGPAAPRGAKALSEIKDSAEVAHGLCMADGCGEGLEQAVVGPRASSCLD